MTALATSTLDSHVLVLNKYYAAEHGIGGTLSLECSASMIFRSNRGVSLESSAANYARSLGQSREDIPQGVSANAHFCLEVW